MLITRRSILKGLTTVPLATVLADPLIARAIAAGLETVTTVAGGKTVAAALALPTRVPAPTVMLIHEWWGLNDQIKSVAAELAKKGYMALAIDLYDGKVADQQEEANALTQTLDPARATATLAAWIDWLKNDPNSAGKVATIGWCFGGGWSLNASLAAPVDATVIYYGDVRKTAKELARLKGPVLGHFATRDRWITLEMITDFDREMKAAGGSLTVHWYEADHAFANPTSARYDAEDAALAWRRTLAFLETNL